MGTPSLVHTFDPWDREEWHPQHHELGRGQVHHELVRQGDGVLRLAVGGDRFHGSEVRSTERLHYGSFEARLRTPHAPGTISAFFLYQFVPGHRNDEIDIEILNDGSRWIFFTTWIGGKRTRHRRLRLPFDPSQAFHDYRIEWDSERIRFIVDGEELGRFTGPGVPTKPLYLMVNAWWPLWEDWPAWEVWQGEVGPPPGAALEVERIVHTVER